MHEFVQSNECELVARFEESIAHEMRRRIDGDRKAMIEALTGSGDAPARPMPDEARQSIGRVAEHLLGLAAEVEPPRMADGFEADRMRLLAHRLRDVAAMLPDADEARRLVDKHERSVLLADGYTTARAALLRALGVEA